MELPIAITALQCHLAVSGLGARRTRQSMMQRYFMESYPNSWKTCESLGADISYE